MRRRIATITDVAERHLCCGCGVCAYAQPGQIRMVDDLSTGRRPVVAPGVDTSRALSMCPGVEMHHDEHPDGVDPDLLPGWGPVLEVWEGHATDPEIRYGGSSGGLATALGLHAVTDGGLSGVIHINHRADIPLLNETIISSTRGELVAATGSRYAPASPCDGLQHAIDAPRPVAFIGKPCDVAAASKARGVDAALDDQLDVTIAIFCAGAPSTNGTLEMITALGIDDPRTVSSLRYRGRGWPGRATVRTFTEPDRERSLSYAESWGDILQKHRPWRCRVCIDHTGEFADISVGDPWYRQLEPDEIGSSLVVVRSERGRAYVRAAIASGHVELERVSHDLLPRSQPNLLKTRGAVWGRLTASRLTLQPAPKYGGMPTFRFWLSELSLAEKARSVFGTVRRVVSRRLFRRRPVVPADESELTPG